MITVAYSEFGIVLLGIVKFGIVKIGISKFVIVKLGMVKLGMVKLGMVKLGIVKNLINYYKFCFSSSNFVIAKAIAFYLFALKATGNSKSKERFIALAFHSEKD